MLALENWENKYGDHQDRNEIIKEESEKNYEDWENENWEYENYENLEHIKNLQQLLKIIVCRNLWRYTENLKIKTDREWSLRRRRRKQQWIAIKVLRISKVKIEKMKTDRRNSNYENWKELQQRLRKWS